MGCLVWKETPLSARLVDSLWPLEPVGRDGFRHSRQTCKHKSRIPCPIFGESRFPGNSQIPDPENTLPDPVLTLYYALVYPYLTYCNLIWASTYITNLQRIYLLQKRAVRAISKADYKASNKPLFANLKILDVFSIYSLQVSSFMYLYHHDALPIAFTQIFQTGNQIHQYSTRYSEFNDPTPVEQILKKNPILFQGPRIWNSLPNNIKNAPTFNIFKRVIKPFLRVRHDTTWIP